MITKNTSDMFLQAAFYDYDANIKDRDMVNHLAELYAVLHELDPENYDIENHQCFDEEVVT
jgi:hypothetical protein